MTEFDRATGLGASEAAAALGLDPYASPTEIWMRKTRQAGEQAETDVMRIGRLLEEPVARLYAHRTGYRVTRHRRACKPCDRAGRAFACHDAAVFDQQYPWLFAHLDRLAYAPEGRRVVEIKTTSRPGDEWGPDGSDQVPLRVLVQAMLQMRLTGLRRADVAAFVWGRDLRRYELEHSPETERQVMDEIRYFWSLVEAGTPPVHPDHRQTGEALRRLYSQDNGLQVVAGEEDWALVEQVLAAYATWKAGEVAYDVAKATMQARLKELAGLQWDGGTITWKTQDRRSTNWRGVAELVGSVAVKQGMMGQEEWDEMVAGATSVEPTRVFRVNVKKGAAEA